jgi:hypothetical protein
MKPWACCRHLHPALDLKIVQAGLAHAGGVSIALMDGWLTRGGPQAWVAQTLAETPQIAVIKGETWCLLEAVECGRLLRRAGVTTIAIGQQVSHACGRLCLAQSSTGCRQPEEEILGLLPAAR